MASSLEQRVAGLENSLGQFFLGERPLAQVQGGHVPVFRQVLDATAYTVAFEPGSRTYQPWPGHRTGIAPPVLS